MVSMHYICDRIHVAGSWMLSPIYDENEDIVERCRMAQPNPGNLPTIFSSHKNMEDLAADVDRKRAEAAAPTLPMFNSNVCKDEEISPAAAAVGAAARDVAAAASYTWQLGSSAVLIVWRRAATMLGYLPPPAETSITADVAPKLV